MYYIDKGSGDCVLFIHGLGSKKESWNWQTNELSKYYRVIAIDLIGHGQNKSTQKITLRNMAANIINLLGALDIKSVHLVGLSLGGVIVQELLHSYPDYVKSTVLSNTISILPYFVGKYAVDHRMVKLKKLTKKEYEYNVTENCLHGIYPEKYISKISEMFLDVNKNTYEDAASIPLGINYTNTLLHNTKPMLVIGSIFDKVTPYINTLTTYWLARHAKLKTFYNSGHIPNIECADEYNQCLLEFYKEIN